MGGYYIGYIELTRTGLIVLRAHYPKASQESGYFGIQRALYVPWIGLEGKHLAFVTVEPNSCTISHTMAKTIMCFGMVQMFWF